MLLWPAIKRDIPYCCVLDFARWSDNKNRISKEFMLFSASSIPKRPSTKDEHHETILKRAFETWDFVRSRDFHLEKVLLIFVRTIEKFEQGEVSALGCLLWRRYYYRILLGYRPEQMFCPLQECTRFRRCKLQEGSTAILLILYKYFFTFRLPCYHVCFCF